MQNTFNERADKRNGFVEISIASHLTPMQAMAMALDISAAGNCEFQFDVYGITICCGEDDLKRLQQDADRCGADAARISYMMHEFSQHTAYALPQPISELEMAYPFTSWKLDSFLSNPNYGRGSDVGEAKLMSIQAEYMNYLFDTLKATSDAGQDELFRKCADRIYMWVVNHIGNSRAYFSNDRKDMFIKLLKEHGMMTDSKECYIRAAGVGQSTWERIEEEGVARKGMTPPGSNP